MIGGNKNGRKGNLRSVEGMIYPQIEKEIPIPHKNFANLNTMHGYEVPIHINRIH